MKQGNERFVDVDCDLCASTHRQIKFVKRGTVVPFPFPIVRCRNCGHVYVTPRLANDALNGLYDESYFSGLGFDRTVNYLQPGAAVLSYYDDVRASLDDACGGLAGKHCLDVGCGTGRLVEALRSVGARAVGSDFSPIALRFCRERGVPTVELPTTQIYDVVTAIEVIEHVPSPTQFLQDLAALTKPGGVIFVGTGNWELVSRQPGTPYVMPEGHIHYFTPVTLNRFFRKVGLVPEYKTFNRHWIAWRLAGRRTAALAVLRRVARITCALAPALGPFPLARKP